MQRKLSSRTTFKPQLEELEERANPSFLLSGNAVQQLAQPLNAIVADMKTTANDLVATLNAAAGVNNPAKFFDVAISDYQRLLTEQHAVLATASANQTFINSAAFAEFQAGDPTDLIVLYFGKVLGLEPVKQLTDPVDQANGIMQSSDVQSAVSDMTNKDTLNGIPLIKYTQTPNF